MSDPCDTIARMLERGVIRPGTYYDVNDIMKMLQTDMRRPPPPLFYPPDSGCPQAALAAASRFAAAPTAA